MPSYGMVTKDFMKHVLSGKKDLMKAAEVRPSTFPSMRRSKLYDQVVAMDSMARYFPDSYAKGSDTLHPESCKACIDHANE